MARAANGLDISRLLYPRITLVAFVWPIFYFVLERHISTTWLLGTFLAYFLYDNLGVEIGVHKLMCHRSFTTTVHTKQILAFLSVLSGQGSPLVWTAVHAKVHHPYSDSEQDVHSPRHGIFHALYGWYWKSFPLKAFQYVVRDYLHDKPMMFIHRNHAYILLSYWALLLLISQKAFIYLGLLPVALSITMVGFVNAFMHSDGKISRVFFLKYKNFPERSTFNSVWLGMLTMGLGFHDNHHENPSHVYYDKRWFEFDPSRLVIPLLERGAIIATRADSNKKIL